MRIITLLLSVIGLLARSSAMAGDSLCVDLNRNVFYRGDTISWQCRLVNADSSSRLATVQLWIENPETGQRWQYRYPLIDGAASGTVIVSASIADGNYALNFLLQKDFFNVRGKLESGRRRDATLNYMVRTSDDNTEMHEVRTLPNHQFLIDRMLFRDTAMFIFSPPANAANNRLHVTVATSLDSDFVPESVVTKMIMVGGIPEDSQALRALTPRYSFSYIPNANSHELDDVTVTAKAKLKMDDFNKSYVSGEFQASDYTFDALDDPELLATTDIFDFLVDNVPGLTVRTRGAWVRHSFYWPSEKRYAPMYLNEQRVDGDALAAINPADIALIKVWRGGSGFMRGAISVYTRHGNFDAMPIHRYVFYIRGYDALDEVWR